MHKIEKSAAEKALDEIVDKLTADGMVVVYALGRYDDIPSHGQKARFSSRISYNDGLDPDPVVEAVTLGFNRTGGISMTTFLDTVGDLKDEGWDVYIGYGNYNPKRETMVAMAEFFTRYADPDESHRQLDLLREVIVEWSNARHTSQLVWQE